jgi:hypothetical protein
MSAATTPSSAPQKLTFKRILLAGLIAIVGASVANVIVGWIGKLFVSAPGFMPLEAPNTIFFTTLFLVGATLVYALINRFTSNPVRIFGIVSVVGLLITLLPDFLLLINPSGLPPEMGTPTFGAVMILIVQHFVGYAIAMWAFLRWAPQR